MAAYMIVYARIHDRRKFLEGYAQAAARLVEEFGGRYVLRAPGALALEGDISEGMSVVISEWPDKETALEFWNSAAYAEVRKLREGIADAIVTVVEADKFT